MVEPVGAPKKNKMVEKSLLTGYYVDIYESITVACKVTSCLLLPVAVTLIAY